MGIGKVVQLDAINSYIESKLESRIVAAAVGSELPWYNPKRWVAWFQPRRWWQSIRARITIAAATQLIVTSLDDLIEIVERHLVSGADKKTTVLEALGRIFDSLILPMLPFYIRPFAGIIRILLLNKIAPWMIDFIVKKYNAGVWPLGS